MTGGRSQLWPGQTDGGRDRIKTRVAKDPVKCVALGAGIALGYIAGNIPEGIIDLSKISRLRRPVR